MIKITRISLLSVLTVPTLLFANYPSSLMVETNSTAHEQQIDTDLFSQENQSDNLNSEMIGDRSWETTSSRMNRQAAATSNTRTNPNWQRRDQTDDRSWETTSSRMNRQAAEAAHTRFNPRWNRDWQNRNDPNAEARNVQR